MFVLNILSSDVLILYLLWKFDKFLRVFLKGYVLDFEYLVKGNIRFVIWYEIVLKDNCVKRVLEFYCCV